MSKITVKERILQFFLEHQNAAVSGESLAEDLQVSRTAVWKAICALREEGYRIEGTQNLGYRMLLPDDSEEKDRFNAAEIRALLPEDARAFYEIHTTPKTGSTNTDVREAGIRGEREGFVLLAESQTAGRGRQGRSFYSPKGSGLYLSILLRPSIPAAEAVLITAMAGVAASRAVEALLPEGHEKVMIKWVNDLYYHGHKVCGILTEGLLSMETGGFDQAVLGLGFNLVSPEGGWPAEIREVAGGLFSSGKPAGARVKLAAAFLREFLPLYRGLQERTFLPEYRSRMLVLGETVDVLLPDGTEKAAEAVDIDDHCRLLVRFSGEDVLTPLGSGEVRIKISS